MSYDPRYPYPTRYTPPAKPALPTPAPPHHHHPPAHDAPYPYAASTHSSLSSSSYAGSADDDDAVELETLLHARLAAAFEPLTLDRALVVQAQTSGMLNAKTRELEALQEEARRRLEETREAFADGMRAAKEVRKDLAFVHKKVRELKGRTERKFPVEYNMARERMPSPGQ